MATTIAETTDNRSGQSRAGLWSFVRSVTARFAGLRYRAGLEPRRQITHTSVLTDSLERDYYASSPRYDI